LAIFLGFVAFEVFIIIQQGVPAGVTAAGPGTAIITKHGVAHPVQLFRRAITRFAARAGAFAFVAHIHPQLRIYHVTADQGLPADIAFFQIGITFPAKLPIFHINHRSEQLSARRA
jgi:hypothetical protein